MGDRVLAARGTGIALGWLGRGVVAVGHRRGTGVGGSCGARLYQGWRKVIHTRALRTS